LIVTGGICWHAVAQSIPGGMFHRMLWYVASPSVSALHAFRVIGPHGS
jgi:hypothetical protein